MASLEHELKELIIKTLTLEDITPADINTEEPLFGDAEGLGLDSIDALELGIALQQTYAIKIDADDEDTRAHFASVAQLAAFVRAHQEA